LSVPIHLFLSYQPFHNIYLIYVINIIVHVYLIIYLNLIIVFLIFNPQDLPEFTWGLQNSFSYAGPLIHFNYSGQCLLIFLKVDVPGISHTVDSICNRPCLFDHLFKPALYLIQS
jgi:hypothetical protein